VKVPAPLLGQLHRRASASRWDVSEERFHEALVSSAVKTLGDAPGARELERYLSSIHLEDLALACACADGHEAAWDHFVRALRPVLYRSADALEPGGGARDVADGLYADLFGLQEREGRRQSLLRYFHGRSSLATWLRAVLAQRFVDRVRGGRRLEPLPEHDDAPTSRGGLRWASAPAFTASAPDPDRNRYLALMCAALAAALGRLADRDRLRMSLYYAQQLTLAQAGKLLNESEATVSRQLARTRGVLRKDVEDQLAGEHRLSAAEIARCFESIAQDAGPLDVGVLLGSAEPRKNEALDRSE
jgi:RNA polymerase sigma factor (sigma-70 family)